MNRPALAPRRLATLVLVLLVSMLVAAPAATAAEGGPATASVAKGCKKGKKGKKKSCGKKRGQKKGAKNGGKDKATPDPGPYREGQTCSMSEQAEYRKHGFICIDISTPGFPLTVLAPL